MKKIGSILITISLMVCMCACSVTTDKDVEIVEPVIEYLPEESGTEAVVETEPEIEEITEEQIEEIIPENNQINLIMVGDILLHTPVQEAAKREDGSYDYTAVFEHTKDEIEAADIALVNQEVIIGGTEMGVSGYPAFNCSYDVADALVENGFDVMCHATNHALDKGKKGILNCIENWREKYPDIAVLGIHDTEDTADEIYYYEQNGIRVAILNFTYGTNGIPMPTDMPYAVDILNKERCARLVSEAEENADITVVCPHWGVEYNTGISSDERKWTDIFVENGADIIIGTHPHVIEPIEEVTCENNANKAIVYYSLGNYVNWTSGSGAGVANRMVGGMANVTIERNEAGEVVVADYGVDALVCHLTSGTDGVSTYFLRDYDAEMGAENEIIRQDGSFSYDYCVELCNNVWGDKWR